MIPQCQRGFFWLKTELFGWRLEAQDLGASEIGFCISSIASVDSSVQIPTPRHSPNPEYVLTAPFSFPALKFPTHLSRVPDARKRKRLSVFKANSTVSQELFRFR
jgi:hypothetical protein